MGWSPDAMSIDIIDKILTNTSRNILLKIFWIINLNIQIDSYFSQQQDVDIYLRGHLNMKISYWPGIRISFAETGLYKAILLVSFCMEET